MAKYIVTAAKLNRRKSIPSVLPDTANINGVVLKNFIFDGEEIVSVPNPALGKWYKDANGFFYWGGALALVNVSPVQPVVATPGNISVQQIKAATVSTTINAERFMPFINDTCTRFKINTPARILSFLAQVGHESAGLFYTEELASGKAYEGRKDLGNTEPGDGVRFKGRGLIQITGRANYKSISNDLGVDFISSPSFLGGKNASVCSQEQLRNAALSAGWYWNKHNINAKADKIDITDPIEEDSNFDHFEDITRAINGGTNGLADRVARYRAGLPFFR